MPHGATSKKDAFLAAYAECGVVRYAAEAAGTSRENHYRWLKNDSEYAEKFDQAQKDACDLLEREARRRAVEGTSKIRFHSKSGLPLADPDTGEPYRELEYSDTLLIFLMKGAMPEKYRERIDSRVSGGIDVSGHIALQEVSQEIEQDNDYVEFVRQRAGTGGPDSDSGGFRPTNGNGQVAVRKAPPGDRPGNNGHHPGKNGTGSGD